MSRTVGIVIDSTFGVTKEFQKKNNISVVPLKVIIEDKEFVDGELDPKLVIKALTEQKSLKTSQPSPEAFINAYEAQLKDYDEVIALTLSSALSGTFNSANLAKTIIENDKVFTVDSETTISGGVYLVEKLVEFLNSGKSAEEGIKYLESIKDKGSLIFTVDNLQQLVANGRLNKVQAFIGNMLKVKPILRFRRGVLSVEHKARSFNNVLKYLVDQVDQLRVNGEVSILINYVDQSEKAKELQHEIYQLSKDVSVRLAGIVSPVISAHVGLGGLGIYLTNE
jgi:DegV family protein with EDD domain